MVKVAAAVEVVAGILCSGGLGLPWLVCHLVVGADTVNADAPLAAVPFLFGEIIPACDTVAVVHHHVSDDACAFFFICCDHRTQLLFRAESRFMVCEPILRHIAHIACAAAPGRIRDPYQTEVFADFIGLAFKVCPLRIVIGIPEETLEHYALVVFGPCVIPGIRSSCAERGGTQSESSLAKEVHGKV